MGLTSIVIYMGQILQSQATSLLHQISYVRSIATEPIITILVILVSLQLSERAFLMTNILHVRCKD